MTANSMVETAYQYIREQILKGQRMPGTVLSENELASEIGMSRTPIRSAVSRLEQEGYLLALKNRGVLVKEIPFREMLDTFELILTLQISSFDLSQEKNASYDLGVLGEKLRLQVEATEQRNYSAYIDHGLAFFRGVIQGAQNVMMLRVIDSLGDRFKQSAMVNYNLTPASPHFSMTPLNQAVYQAIEAGDYGRAKEVLHGANMEARRRALQGQM
ncbi:GntR family transcriptional regulator [Paenibacillus mucilaginosus]|uniref:GntR family transcriptional regulator n=3 Tax=Paenibacillus mucilaginosus TaxID=61624 RepID=H6NI37_9BACL|nr:GntR family transcriptional regulator [Paenibacillus mucilaginosus]AFH63130.1 GntR family transcriptional regulator [Paenibacillus mucilaginosus K02]AFC30808.1 GntR family transcriptional regulator [Paenibacillus mucilaginosus 3016]MCG7212292.1 GntR family transcriptional regulator [Paenibacillus mucilaginosus]WDM24747.1 GntR family transcriptional regulator [Paenibacillus mucilaginosus]WFA19414.1 GntR family transcriptional regulator [Paenibacillus mucilaginosus]